MNDNENIEEVNYEYEEEQSNNEIEEKKSSQQGNLKNQQPILNESLNNVNS